VPEGPIAARGITIATIEVNQGVAVNVYADGDWVDGGGRNAEIVKNRLALFRGFWTLEEGFEPREITAQLDLHFEDGSMESASVTTLVEGPSEAYSTDKTFTIGVPAEFMVPGLRFLLSLFEADTSYASLPEPATPPVYPTDPQWVGVETAPMELRVMLVPIDHDIGDTCPEPPVLDEFALQIFEEQLYMHNPVESVELLVHDLYTWTEPLTSFGGILGALAELHGQDGTDPGIYYYGVVRPCDGGPDGVGGQAIDIPGFPSMGNAWSRTAVGRWYGDLQSTAGTFVHEIGHTQGRRHVYCNGEEGGPDPSYPYEAGAIGTWGFGVIDFSLHSGETAKDYMTYCGNTWVSDWGWHKVFPYVEEITSWDLGGPLPGDGAQSQLLVGLVDPAAGSETWFVTPGTASGRASMAGERIEIAARDGRVHELPATVGAMGEGGAYNLVVELPGAMDVASATGLARVGAAGRTPIERVRVHGSEIVLGP
jgi:hypothetical protein